MEEKSEIYKHFGIRPRNIVVDCDGVSWDSELFAESPNFSRKIESQEYNTPVRCRRGAVIGGHKEMAVVHENHKNS